MQVEQLMERTGAISAKVLVLILYTLLIIGL